MSSGIGRLKPDKMIQGNFDLNVLGGVTEAIETVGRSHVGFFVCNKSGGKVASEVTLQISPNDGETWFDTDDVIIGEGFIKNDVVVCDQIRAKVTKAEGSASNACIIIIVE